MAKTFSIAVVNKYNSALYEEHTTYHEGDSGLDLFITDNVVIEPKQTVIVDLGITCQSYSYTINLCNIFKCKSIFEKQYHSYLLIPRSSISKTPLLMRNSIGLIDKGYTGTLKVPLYNTSDEAFQLKRGQRYVQLVNSDLSEIYFHLVSEQRQTSRGSGGFGSTGQ